MFSLPRVPIRVVCLILIMILIPWSFDLGAVGMRVSAICFVVSGALFMLFLNAIYRHADTEVLVVLATPAACLSTWSFLWVRRRMSSSARDKKSENGT